MDANKEAFQPQTYADKSVEDDGEWAPDGRTMQYASTPLRLVRREPDIPDRNICVNLRPSAVLFPFVSVSIRSVFA